MSFDVKKITLAELSDEIKSPTEIGKDCVVALTGEEGEGKSLSATQIARAIFPEFDLWNNIIYSKYPAEYNDKYKMLLSGVPFQIDEAIELMYKMDFMKYDVKELVKKFAAQQRKEKHAIYLLCISCLKDLSTYWREHRVKYWIELMPREEMAFENAVAAMVFKKPRIPFTPAGTDVWMLKKYYELWMKKYQRYGYTERVVEIMRNHPYYIGEVKIPKPSHKIEREYLRFRGYAYKKYAPRKEEPSLTLLQEEWRRLAALLLLHLQKRYGYKLAPFLKESGIHMERTKVSQAMQKYTKDFDGMSLSEYIFNKIKRKE